MADTFRFLNAFPYQKNVLALPVSDIESATDWYGYHFGMNEVERPEGAEPTVILERQGVRIGFAINGEDPTQDGAAIQVDNAEQARAELESKGVKVGELQTDERDGKTYLAFFVVAPDGLCYYFHQLLNTQ